MADPRYLEWKRLAAEGGVVVVSILLAFWIDASWDGFLVPLGISSVTRAASFPHDAATRERSVHVDARPQRGSR